MTVLLGHDHGQGHGGHDYNDENENNHEHTDDMHTHGMTIKTLSSEQSWAFQT